MSLRTHVACALSVLLLPCVASAQLVVSEVMYDLQSGSDTGREWVEVFNASEDSIPITEWKLFEGGSNHTISGVQGGDTLPTGAYAIIADNPAKFLIDWPGYSGILYDTAFSGGLSNTGESITVGYLLSGTLVPTDALTYASSMGGAGDGSSLQRSTTESSTFASGVPTPGSGSLTVITGLHLPSGTIETEESSTTAQTANQHTSATLGVVSSYVPPPEPLIYAYAGKDRDVIAGADVLYEGQAYDKKGAWLSASSTRFLWNFGDGSVGDGPQILHHFNIPGRYAVVLSVANATNAASAKIAVNVHPVSITMSEKSGSIVLTNTSAFELDLSRWFFRGGDVLFTLPENTTLLARASAAFVASTTGITEPHHAELLYPNGTVAAVAGAAAPSAPAALTAPPPPAPLVVTKSKFISKSAPKPPPKDVVEERVETIATSVVQTAAVGAATGSGYTWWFAAAALALATGAVASLLSRSKKLEWDIEESE